MNIKGEDLFLNKRLETIEGLGEFEIYPNRDSVPYKEIYGLKDAETVMRGTYRNIGWCDTFKKIIDLGIVDESPVERLSGMTLKEMMADIAGVDAKADVMGAIAKKIDLPKEHFVLKNLEWLGLFSDGPLADVDNRLDALSEQLLKKLQYQPGEKDMLILRHTFVIEKQDGSPQTITSTMIDYGIPHGDSSMARTVSLPHGHGRQAAGRRENRSEGRSDPGEKRDLPAGSGRVGAIGY